MTPRKVFSVWLFVVIGLVGCDSSDDDSSGDTSMPDGSDEEIASAPATLLGEWRLDCVLSDPEEPDVEYATQTLTFTDNLSTSEVQYFSDSGCSNLIETVLVESSVVYPEGTAATGLGNASFIDTTLESVLFDGEPLPEEEPNFVNIGQTTYSIFLVVDNLLYLGDIDLNDDGNGIGLNGSTPELRPTSLDQSQPRVRQ
ncbi:MAG: hypothetical protein KTR35_23370 [Gammaproteobacteria bacterium]|nr:hypothetical protein [Gammaproteobacteria bacterium]